MKILLAAVLAVCAAGAAAESARAEKWDARIAETSGDVSIQPADGSPEVSAEADMPLEDGDRVVVGEGGSAEVALDGGSLITVKANSDLKIEQSDKGDSSFFLAAGALLAKIQKLGNHRLKIRTPHAVAAVRGTEFGVEVEGEHSHVGVFDEGKVEVSGGAGGAPELLISNQETSVKQGAGPGHAAQLNRFIARRAAMRAHGRRIAAIKAKWKALPPEQRREMRKKLMEKMRERRKAFIEKRQAMREKIEQKRKEKADRGQQRRQENLRKMEERRSKARRNRQ